MLKQLGKLEIRKSADYCDTVVKALEEAGFVIVLELETTTENYYVVAKEDSKFD